MINVAKLAFQRAVAALLFYGSYVAFYDAADVLRRYSKLDEALFRFAIPSIPILCTALCLMAAAALFFRPVYDRKKQKFREFSCLSVLIAVSAALLIAFRTWESDGEISFGALYFIFYGVPALALLLSLRARHAGNKLDRTEYRSRFDRGDPGYLSAMPEVYYRLKPPKRPLNRLKLAYQTLASVLGCVSPIVAVVSVLVAESGKEQFRFERITPAGFGLVLAANALLMVLSIALFASIVSVIRNSDRKPHAETPPKRAALFVFCASALLAAVSDALAIDVNPQAANLLSILAAILAFLLSSASAGMLHPKDFTDCFRARTEQKILEYENPDEDAIEEY